MIGFNWSFEEFGDRASRVAGYLAWKLQPLAVRIEVKEQAVDVGPVQSCLELPTRGSGSDGAPKWRCPRPWLPATRNRPRSVAVSRPQVSCVQNLLLDPNDAKVHMRTNHDRDPQVAAQRW